MTYEDIYSSFYLKIDDPTFFSLPQEEAYSRMKNWLHDSIAIPYIRDVFSSIKLNDETLSIKYSLKETLDEDSDKDFVIKLLSDAMVIKWLNPKIDSMTNLAVVIGGKDEKRLQSNYKQNIERAKSLEKELRKIIRDRNYTTNDYLEE